MKWQTLGEALPRTRNPLTRFIGRGVFRLLGWRIEGEVPNRSKMVVALVPHTSNMDFIVTIAVLWGLGLQSAFMMKRSLFWFPLGRVLSALGGMPVDRSAANGLVQHMSTEFARRSQLILGITPEGTRGAVSDFKLGFARIAQSARVPVLPAVLNYETCVVRFGELIEDVSDVAITVVKIRDAAMLGMPKNR
ncbi:acyltransferase family protein [Luminiphilus syltensis NOR5-1B]|uniref:Acyltransferase family protein n=1 Tax=Luminiphilus syltensis NOR5-1B TaxID=565045 RepID=B8KTJ5_9GAMM|nr:1-acyl-sn-glycerol-3-phosphate acyltransferase [Luminiphilus syltensis]EED34693.1 acyltransferase family protein [Luminiphilus syltensis NOR5-1B]